MNEEKNHVRHNALRKIKSTFDKIKKVPFLKGMVIVILLQFMLTNLLEFQYTKAIEQTLHAQVYGGEEFEHQLTQNLALLQIVFSAGGLLVQLLITSRLISSLGIVSSMIIHPIVTLLHLIAMALQFNFFTAAIGRSNFEITGEVFRNAYHSSYYAVSEQVRSQIREVLEGFVKPLGAIVAFILFYTIQTIATPQNETLLITITMIGIATLMMIRTQNLRGDYTDLSQLNLAADNDLPTRLNAIEILGQNGHKKIKNQALLRHLKNSRENSKIKIKILQTLGTRQDPETLPEILDCLKDPEEEIRATAVETLSRFKTLKDQVEHRAFTRYRTVQTLKKIFETEESNEIKTGIIQLLAKIDQRDIIPFLIETMENGNEKMKQACIKACGTFKDPNIITYLERFLDDKSHRIRSETIVALWPFKKLHKQLKHYLEQMRSSKKKDAILGALSALSEIGTKNDLPYMIQNLASKDQEIRQEAARALGKRGHPASIPHIVQFMMDENNEIAHKTKQFVRGLKSSMVENIEQLVHIRISEYIHELLRQSGSQSLSELDIMTLEKLKNAYMTVDEHDQVFKIEKLIQEKSVSLTLLPNVASA